MAIMISHSPTKDRVKKGKGEEFLIADKWKLQLAKQGATLDEVDEQQDMHDKVDRILTTQKGTKFRVQIKYREIGEDVLVELVKNINTWEPGRDMVGVADLYLCVGLDKVGRLYWTKHIKPDAQAIINSLKQKIEENPHVPWWYPDAPYNKWQINVGIDNYSGTVKVRGYFSVDAYTHQSFRNL